MWLCGLVAAATSACGSSAIGSAHDATIADATTVNIDAGVGRNATTSPAIVTQDSYTTLYALSDVHGGYDRMVTLLAHYNLIAPSPATPSAMTWTGGDATLIVIGDLIDKGAQSLEVVDSLRALQTSATAAGGHVIVTMGNHEAEFLANPDNSKAAPFDSELTAAMLSPSLVATTDPRGVWFRNLPLGAKIGDWFFAHAANTQGLTIAQLEQNLDAALNNNGFTDSAIIGDESILESRDWWMAAASTAQTNATALGVSHIVFGHTPTALGAMGTIQSANSHLLFRIDCGMSPAVDYSKGYLFRLTHDGTDEVATALAADGTTSELFRGAASSP